MVIYISGVHSGPSPAAGVGVARCLRAAFPESRLIAVDDTSLSSGLSAPEFDEFRCVPGWESLDEAPHAQRVRSMIGGDGVWLAVSDREVWWLASALPGARGIPNPSASALAVIQKPAAKAAELLNLLTAPWATLNSEWNLHTFCRRSGWDVWVKGVRADAIRISSWAEMHAAVIKLSQRGAGDRGVFVQRHIEGRGEAVAFSAHSGKLLGAVAVRKRVTTDTGKTWTGNVTAIPQAFDTALRRFVAETGWTGGGEIEMIRDHDGRLWLMEINPRFPGWIHGAALAGINLPALLVAAELGIEAPPTVATSQIFTRMVIEFPVRPEVAALMDGKTS